MSLAVQETAELVRVRNLPRRVLADPNPAALEELSRLLCPRKQIDPGCRERLLPIQFHALTEAFEVGGLLAAIAVGGGKTLLTYLLPTVFQAKAPMLLIPAALFEKTWIEFEKLRVAGWVSPNPMYQIVTYTQMTRDTHAEFLDRANPDLVVADESDAPGAFQNGKNSTTKRFDRFFEKTGARYCDLTGSLTRKSILDYAHRLRWALRDRAPVPASYGELEEWSSALDLDAQPVGRYLPGALLTLSPTAGTTRDAARECFARRLAETPGVVLSGEGHQGELRITSSFLPEDRKIDDVFEHFRTYSETPSGESVSDELSKMRVAETFGCGFEQYWDPPAPPDWNAARKAWHKFARDKIDSSHQTNFPMDTEMQVAKWAKYYELRVYLDWNEIKDTFVPNSVPRWFTMSAVSVACAALNEPGILWVAHTTVGELCEKLTGASYFGPKGLDKNGRSIEKVKDDRVILSCHANRRGRNLQRFSKNTLFPPLPAGTYWEQTLGRTHRTNQDKPVTVSVLLGCLEHESNIWKAQREAEFVKQTTGFEQKILAADWSHGKSPNTWPRWAKKAA